MLRHGRSVALTAITLLLAVPAVASAAMDARAVVHTAGPLAGRVSVVAHVDHVADPNHGYDDVHIVLSRAGTVLADGTEHFMRSSGSIHAPHRLVLSAAQSRRVRAVARRGRLRVTVTNTPRSASAALRLDAAPPTDPAAPAAPETDTQTVSLQPSDEAGLGGQYLGPGGNPTVYVVDIGGFDIDHITDRATGASWYPETAAGARVTCAGATCTWSEPGTWQQADGTKVAGPARGSFDDDGLFGHVQWDAAGSVPAGSAALSEN